VEIVELENVEQDIPESDLVPVVDNEDLEENVTESEDQTE